MDTNRDALGGVCAILNNRMVSVPGVANLCRRCPPVKGLVTTAYEKVLKKLLGVVVYDAEEFVWQERRMCAFTIFHRYLELKRLADTT